MSEPWKCPRCRRSFRQANQRHSCGTGDRAALLQNKSPEIVALYRALEKVVATLPGVEIVTKDRYALFRTTRIFADVVFMKDCLRLAIHLGRAVTDPAFLKVARGDRHVSHVVMLRRDADVRAMAPYLAEAHGFSLRD